MKTNSGNIAWGIAIITLLVSFFYHISVEKLNIISWDVYGYYLYLPALFKYQDTSQYLFSISHLKEYAVSENLYQLTDFGGVKAPIYTMGMAILYSPFYAVADSIARIIPSLKADGLSAPYQWSIIIASWTYLIMGIVYARKLLQQLKLPDAAISWTLLVVFLGTNYFHYVAFENGMPHSFLFTLYILLLYSIICWHNKPRIKYAMAIGGILGLHVICRPSEILAVLIPLLYGIYNGLTFLIKKNKVKINSTHLLLLIGTGLLTVLPQLLFWKINLGVWFYDGYSGHHFDFFSPHIIDGLFSFRKGWLVYTPLASLGFIGMTLIWKRDRRWFYGILLFTILNIYLVLSWHIWWYASSFSMRALIQSLGVFIIPIAFLIEAILKKKVYWRNVFLGLITVLILLNQFQDWQYRKGILLQDEMTHLYYSKAFLATEKNKLLRIYVDTDDDFKAEYNKISSVYRYESDSPSALDTILPDTYSHTYRTILDKKALSGGDWLSMNYHLRSNSGKYGKWNQARAVTQLSRKSENIKWRGIRFQYLLEIGKIKVVSYDFKIPDDAEAKDELMTTIWNTGPDTLFLERIEVNKYQGF